MRVYLDVLDEMIERAHVAGFKLPVVILGDFNAEKLDNPEDYQMHWLIRELIYRGYIDAINGPGAPTEPTWQGSDGSKSTLDYIFVKNCESVVGSVGGRARVSLSGEVSESDHNSLHAVLQVPVYDGALELERVAAFLLAAWCEKAVGLDVTADARCSNDMHVAPTEPAGVADESAAESADEYDSDDEREWDSLSEGSGELPGEEEGLEFAGAPEDDSGSELASSESSSWNDGDET